MADTSPTCKYVDRSSFNEEFQCSEPNFSVMHLNARSIKNKEDNLNDFVSSLCVKFDVLLFTETWLSANDAAPNIQDYKYDGLVRDKRKGGGVAIYTKQSISYEVVDDFCKLDINIECMTIIIKNTVIAVVYRPPSGSMLAFFEFIEELLRYVGSTGASLMILGDVNINITSQDSDARDFSDLLTQYACVNLITIPTRVTAETATTLDICLTNLEEKDTTSGVFTENISDHLPIYCLSSVSKRKQNNTNEPYFFREINSESLEKFYSLIERADWNAACSEGSADLAYSIFFNKFKKCYDEAFPLKTANPRKKKTEEAMGHF